MLSFVAKEPHCLQHAVSRSLDTKGSRSHFSDPDSAPVPKFLNPDPGPEFSNLRVRLLFRLRLPSIQPKFTMFLLKKWPGRDYFAKFAKKVPRLSEHGDVIETQKFMRWFRGPKFFAQGPNFLLRSYSQCFKTLSNSSNMKTSETFTWNQGL